METERNVCSAGLLKPESTHVKGRYGTLVEQFYADYLLAEIYYPHQHHSQKNV